VLVDAADAMLVACGTSAVCTCVPFISQIEL
jgi:hypothetical protein